MKSLDEKIAELHAARREKVEARAAELIAGEQENQTKNAEAIARLLDMAKDDLLQDVDGFYYYFPKPNGGSLSPWMLRAIADELDRKNAPYEAELEEYFRTHP